MFSNSQGGGGSSLFGQQGGNSGGLFGGGGGAGSTFGGAPSAFGSATTPGFGSQQQGGGSMFGSSTAQSGSLFGNTGAGGSFGPSTQSQGAGGLFGSGGQTSAFGSSAGGGLFGSGTGGAFGAGTGGSMFGQPGAGSGLFGSKPAQSSMFGASAFPSTMGGGGVFNNSSSFGSQSLGALTPYGQAQQQQQQQRRLDRQSEYVLAVEAAPYAPWWYRELVRIQAAYRVGQFCKFQTMMYEVSPTAPDVHGQTSNISVPLVEQTKALRRRQILEQVPWIENNMREWQVYEERNPDPANWLPCPVIGIDALKARVDAQKKYTEDQLQSVEKERNQDWLANAAANIQLLDQRIESCRRTHATVTHRLVSILGRLEKLQARYAMTKGPRGGNEVKFHERLEKVRRTLDDSRGCKARLLQIEARLSEMLANRSQPSDVLSERSNNEQTTSESSAEQRRADDEDEKRNRQLLSFLEEQRRSIATVVEVLKRDARDIRWMKERLMN